jgi:hypothetical protein
MALRSALFVLGGARFVDEVAAPLLVRVGQAWVDGALTVAHEHAVSAVLRRVLDELGRGLDVPADAPVIVVATPSGDRHEFGALLAAATAAAAGWRVVYLGSDLPAADIARAARQAGSALVGVSVGRSGGAGERTWRQLARGSGWARRRRPGAAAAARRGRSRDRTRRVASGAGDGGSGVIMSAGAGRAAPLRPAPCA